MNIQIYRTHNQVHDLTSSTAIFSQNSTHDEG